MSDDKSLVLGGIRSGKSAYAEEQARLCQQAVTYIATAQAVYRDDDIDASWQQRIQAHRERRPPHWLCIEEPLHLAKVLHQHSGDQQCLLVDCLSVWLTNLLLRNDEALLKVETAALLEAVEAYRGRLILVSSESNMGVLPLSDLSRRYCDAVGLLHQQLAARCEQVVLVIAGLPQFLKGASHKPVINEENE